MDLKKWLGPCGPRVVPEVHLDVVPRLDKCPLEKKFSLINHGVTLVTALFEDKQCNELSN